MTLFTSTEWQECTIGETDHRFAETSDPRVLAIIERDNEPEISELYDGDAINPMIYVDHRYGLSFHSAAGYDGGEAALMQRAYEQWGWNETARRWLWIFHGIVARNAPGGYDRSGNWIVASSTAYREHVGIPERGTFDEVVEDCKAVAANLSDALDGYVYGIGWAINERRLLHDDEPIDLEDWAIDTQCWGYVGERYAQECAAGFEAGTPVLPLMLTDEGVFA